MTYEILCRMFGWDLTTVKNLSVRERLYWRQIVEWRLDADGRAAAG